MMQLKTARLCALVIGCALTLAACGGDSADAGGDAAATPSSVATSPTPSVDPLTVARLDGVYAVVKKVTDVTNFTDIKKGDTFKRTYTVEPACETGPCGGTVTIEYKELDEPATYELTYDTSAYTFGLVFPKAPAICTGVDGKKYKLDTLRGFTITPTETTTEGDLVTVSEWTGEEYLKAVPTGAAKSKGKCNKSSATYAVTGAQK